MSDAQLVSFIAANREVLERYCAGYTPVHPEDLPANYEVGMKLAAAPLSVREGGDGPREVFVVLTHDNCFINAFLTREAAEREAHDGGGRRYLVERVELADAEEATDAVA